MTYEHLCHECKHEWDAWYGINDDPPIVCPKCKVEGKVERLISVGAGKGIVPLTGHELKAHVKADAARMVRESASNEKLLSNLVGEDKYHSNELFRDKVRKEK
jgi:putative FmdB family regulatory protein